MPRSKGVLHNCYKVTINGNLQGFFQNKVKAEFYIERWKAFYPQYMKDVVIVIEPWFIEGEF